MFRRTPVPSDVEFDFSPAVCSSWHVPNLEGYKLPKFPKHIRNAIENVPKGCVTEELRIEVVHILFCSLCTSTLNV